MECNCQAQDKEPIANKPPNSHPFTFVHLEIEKPPPYAGNIWVLKLPIDFDRCVKIYIPRMEKWFQLEDRLIKVEHVNVTSRLMNWMLEIDGNGLQQWVEESEDHVDFYVYPYMIHT